MGVKGLYSYLSHEPSRFGRRVKLQDVPKEGFIIFDGPALHYNLLNCICDGLLPPSEEFIDLDDSVIGIISPYSIFNVARKFFEYLLSSVDCHIFVVFDGGISSKYKEEQQIYRIREAYLMYDRSVRSFLDTNERKKYAVPHIFGEEAILEAIKVCADPRIEVHHAKGEAEIFISNFADSSMSANILVISSDSDCLLLPSIPGFVPLQSLFYTDEGLEGWEYTKNHFLSSHPDILDDDPENELQALSCIAAFCGCDYKLNADLQQRITSAKLVILRSNIGGLRERDRNNPSARCVVISVIRFISHFKRKFQKKWFYEMLHEIARSENEKSSIAKRINDLQEALRVIKLIYKGEEEMVESSCANTVELNRLLVSKKMYCKPVVEWYKSDRTNRNKSSNMKNDVDDLISCHSADSRGIWMDYSFSTCRNRIYSYLCQSFPDFRNAAITEFKRIGGIGQPSVISVEKIVKDFDDDSEYCGDIKQVLYRLCSSHPRSGNRLDCFEPFQCLPLPLHSSFLPALMLTKDSHALLFFFMMQVSATSSRNVDNPEYPENRIEYIEAVGRCTLAVFHTKLAMDAIRCSNHNTKSLDYITFNLSSAFCDRKSVRIWNAISSYDRTVAHHVNEVIETLSYYYDFSENVTADNINQLWNAWCKYI